MTDKLVSWVDARSHEMNLSFIEGVPIETAIRELDYRSVRILPSGDWRYSVNSAYGIVRDEYLHLVCARCGREHYDCLSCECESCPE